MWLSHLIKQFLNLYAVHFGYSGHLGPPLSGHYIYYAFYDLSHIFHKQVTNVFQECFCHATGMNFGVFAKDKWICYLIQQFLNCYIPRRKRNFLNTVSHMGL